MCVLGGSYLRFAVLQKVFNACFCLVSWKICHWMKLFMSDQPLDEASFLGYNSFKIQFKKIKSQNHENGISVTCTSTVTLLHFFQLPNLQFTSV